MYIQLNDHAHKHYFIINLRPVLNGKLDDLVSSMKDIKYKWVTRMLYISTFVQFLVSRQLAITMNGSPIRY